VKRLKDKLKDDKNKMIKFTNPGGDSVLKKHQQIPEDQLLRARGLHFASPPKLYRPSFPNTKRFQEYVEYPYDNLHSQSPELPSKAGSTDFGKVSQRKPLFLSPEQLEIIAE